MCSIMQCRVLFVCSLSSVHIVHADDANTSRATQSSSNPAMKVYCHAVVNTSNIPRSFHTVQLAAHTVSPAAIFRYMYTKIYVIVLKVVNFCLKPEPTKQGMGALYRRPPIQCRNLARQTVTHHDPALHERHRDVGPATHLACTKIRGCLYICGGERFRAFRYLQAGRFQQTVAAASFPTRRTP